MQIVEFSEELTRRAYGSLAKDRVIQEAMKALIQELATNKLEALQFWADVEREAAAKGIQKAPDEVFSFDFNNRRFFITKAGKQG